MLNLNQLAAFHTVAQEQSISRAAQHLLVSQPAVSKHIKMLERQVGFRLIDRHARGITLTAGGQELAAYMARMFAIEEQAEQAMSAIRGLQTGQVRVISSTTVGIYWLPPLLVKFRQKHPKINIHLRLAPSAEIRSSLLNFSADLGVSEGDVASPQLSSNFFAHEELVAIAAPTHALAHRRLIKLAQLCEEPFIVRETVTGQSSMAEHFLHEKGMDVKPVMSLGSTEAIKQAVKARIGVAIVPKISVEADLKAGKLVVLRVAELAIRRPIKLWTASDRPPSPAAKALVQLLVPKSVP